MKILFINVLCATRSTGRICANLAKEYELLGHEVKIAYGRSENIPQEFQKYAVRVGTDWDVRLHAIKTRLADKHGLGSKKATEKFLKWAEEYSPDLLWLHNIHGYYLNYEMLFAWIKRHSEMEVKWTLHDCWAFTGHCCYFDMVKCDKWETKCEQCPQKSSYPATNLLSNCEDNFKRKKKAFQGVKNMTLITPSRWLAALVKKSFLREYPVEVIYNKIDTTVFKPTDGDFRDRIGLGSKRIILGVASTWDKRKGLDDFLALAKMIDENSVIVLVGLSEKQLKNLPENVIGIRRTNGQKELAEIYTAADVFVNPTYEDNYPTVNLEARACGTPVITYKTGGSPESAGENAIVVETGNVADLARQIALI